MNLLGFELRKQLFSRKFLYIVLGIVVAVFALFVRNIIFESYIVEEEQQKVEDRLEISRENARIHHSVLDDEPDNEEEHERMLINSSMVNMLYDLRSLVQSANWQERLILENEYLEQVVVYKEQGGKHPLLYNEINHMHALNEKLLENNIQPEHGTYSIALPNFMKQVVDIFISFGAIIIVLFMIGEIMAGEFENRSVNFLLTQPLKRADIIKSKFISSIILYGLLSLVLFVIAFLVGQIFGERGTFAYPLNMETDQVIGFMTISEYMIIAIVVISVTMLLVISLSLLYGLLLKNTLPTLFAILATLLLGYVISSFIDWIPFAWFDPFQYLLPEEIILFQNGRSWYEGVPIILIFTFIIYIISLKKIKKSRVDS